MCGRFTLALSPEDVAALLQLNADLDAELGLTPRWNVAPGQPVVAAAAPAPGAEPEAALFKWGLVPSWAKDPAVGNRMINARSETAAEKPSFRAAWRSRRCLIPADGFYEWERKGKARRPWIFRVTDEPGFCFAGLWETWTPPEGDTLHTCTVLTTEANELLATMHDRMPVILRGDDREAWLKADAGDPLLHELCVPLPAGLMSAHPVSTLVNSPRNDVPECAEAVAPDGDDGQPTLF